MAELVLAVLFGAVILGTLVLFVVMTRASRTLRRRGYVGRGDSPTMRWISNLASGERQRGPREQ